MIKIIIKHKRAFIRYVVTLFLIISVVLLVFTSLLQFRLDENKRSELLHIENNLIDTQNTIISNRINRISGDLLYVADCLRLHDIGDGEYSEVESLWIAFSDRKKIYDQIRYIDANGDEIIRVNRGNNGAELVDQQELQNKKTRYYFSETMSLKEDQIYISKLDLNVEKGQIDIPIKPMMRISIPYYNTNGEFKGIVMLNYLANDFLEQVKQASTTSSGNIFIVNQDGYWLFDSKNKDNEWAFMYDSKEDVRFSNQFPEEWEVIINKRNGHQISQNGAFVFSNVLTSETFIEDNTGYSMVLGSGDWSLISYLPADTKNGILFKQNLTTLLLRVMQKYSSFYLINLIVSIVIACLVTLNKNEREQIEYFSEYDEMTGVYNRRAGLGKLTQLYQSMKSSSCIACICFIDINGLKEVNDTLGHEAGDELILSVILGIKKNTRQNDIVSRLGGDEFLVVFEGIDANKSEEIWKRIVDEYDRINREEDRKYLISVSHGIEEFQCGSNHYIDSVIRIADEKMYTEKREIKKNLAVLKVTQSV